MTVRTDEWGRVTSLYVFQVGAVQIAFRAATLEEAWTAADKYAPLAPIEHVATVA